MRQVTDDVFSSECVGSQATDLGYLTEQEIASYPAAQSPSVEVTGEGWRVAVRAEVGLTVAGWDFIFGLASFRSESTNRGTKIRHKPSETVRTV